MAFPREPHVLFFVTPLRSRNRLQVLYYYIVGKSVLTFGFDFVTKFLYGGAAELRFKDLGKEFDAVDRRSQTV
jgi:hypothetical protein